MKLKLCLISGLLLAGCQQNEQQTKLADSPEVSYQCENKVSLIVQYINSDNQSPQAIVRLQNKHYELSLAPSGSGARYSDGKYTWWNKGKTGFFAVDEKITVANCLSE